MSVLLCCVTADVANRIAGSNEHMKTLVRCSESSGHEGVRSEASRMLALIAKQAKTAGKLKFSSSLPGAPIGCTHSKRCHRKVLLSSFHLNGHTLGFHPQTQKLEIPCTL